MPADRCRREAVSNVRLLLLGGLAVAVAVVLATCPGPRSNAVIDRWLLCEECTSGELQAVVALAGQRLVPAAQRPIERMQGIIRLAEPPLQAFAWHGQELADGLDRWLEADAHDRSLPERRAPT